MKRTSFLLATLAAIALLSCSSDNLTSSADDVNYPQTPALQKVVPDDEVQGIDPGQSTINGTGTVTSGTNITSVKNVSNGSTATSNIITLNFPTVQSSTARITNLEFCPGSSSGTGIFDMQKLWISCTTPTGSRSTTISYTTSGCVTTSYFSGLAIPTSCSFSFTGKCTAGGPCTKTLSSCRSVAYYQF